MKSFFKCLKKIFILFVWFLPVYLICSLATFSPFDDTYFQFTGNSFFHNALGKLGALSADFLFFIFGWVAYLFPCTMFFVNWIYFFKKEFLNLFNLFFKILGSIILLFSFCGLSEFFIDDFYYCFSGGIVGYFLRVNILCMFNDTTINIILLFFLILGGFLLGNIGRFSLYENFFLDIQVKSNFEKKYKAFKILIIAFISRLNKYVKIKDFHEKKLRYIDILKRVFSIRYLFYIIYVFKLFIIVINKYFSDKKRSFIFRFIYIHSISGLLFRRLRVWNLNSNDISLSKVPSYDQYNKLYHEKSSGHILNFLPKEFTESKENETQGELKKSHDMMQSSTSQLNLIERLGEQELFEKKIGLLPSVNLLSLPSFMVKSASVEDVKKKSELLELKLLDYRIHARVVNILQGPVVTRFELDLAPGIKSSSISNLSRDLARSLSICSLKIIEVIPGKPYIGLEIPNQERETVYLREILDTKQFRESHGLILGLGKDISGLPVFVDLIDMPHLLIAGTTGSGKSVGINSMIVSILYKFTPENVRFIMVDPKVLELSVYNGIPHLITDVVTSMNEIIDVLNWCIDEMERRYKVMACCGVRNLKNYNSRVQSKKVDNFSKNNSYFTNDLNNITDESVLTLKKLPYIIIVVDEFADLVMVGGKKVELLIIRLSQKARACGMHLILATQRPSVNVITGLIKANIPSRIAFTVSSKIDSRTILDTSGAEALLGRGDMLYLGSYSSTPIRVHGTFISDDEISSIVRYWKYAFK